MSQKKAEATLEKIGLTETQLKRVMRAIKAEDTVKAKRLIGDYLKLSDEAAAETVEVVSALYDEGGLKLPKRGD
jgi:hypothetical protein